MTRPLRRSARLALVCPPISGHLNPTLALGSELQRRGFRVAWFGVPDGEARVRAAGLEFVTVGADAFPPGTVARLMRRQGELTGLAAMRWILDCLRKEGLVHMRDLPQAWAGWGAEGALIDQVYHGAASAAQAAGLPYLTLCSALPVHTDLGVPPFATTWRHRPGRWARLRNGLGMLPQLPAYRAYVGPLNVARRHRGLGPLTARNMGESTRAVIAQLPAALEFPGRRFPPHYHLTGPWVRPGTRETVPFPFDRLDGRPLVYASMGTLQNRILDIFRTIAEACAPLEVQLVLALGGADADLPGPLPGNPIVVPFAPQLELLKRAALAITHAGLNSALESLMFGVPLVALPVANDQPGVASRIRHHGAGEIVALRRLQPGHLREVIERVLGGPAYREAARRLQRELAATDGVRLAADLVGENLG